MSSKSSTSPTDTPGVVGDETSPTTNPTLYSPELGRDAPNRSTGYHIGAFYQHPGTDAEVFSDAVNSLSDPAQFEQVYSSELDSPYTGETLSTTFTTDTSKPSRCMSLKGFPVATGPEEKQQRLNDLLPYPDLREATGYHWDCQGTMDNLNFFFEDLACAEIAFDVLRRYCERSNCLLAATYISDDQYCRTDRQGAALQYDSEYAGQAKVKVMSKHLAHLGTIFKVIQQLAERYGDLYAMKPCGDLTPSEANMRVEFNSLVACQRFLNVFKVAPFETMEYLIDAKPYLPDGYFYKPWRGSALLGGLIIDGRQRPELLVMFNANAAKFPVKFNGRIGFPTATRYSSENDSSRVDRDRILRGLDVRSTVMLRNVPNDMSVAQFLDVLNALVFGRFDFAYLRIDFKTGRNVGYAFINFIAPTDVLTFVDRISGLNWAVFGDESKVAQVSYASNQGAASSVENARNSAVMQNWTWVRPKLFYPDIRARSTGSTDSSPRGTNDAAYTGTERPFNPPNNATKLARSLENVRNNGLFGGHRSLSSALYAFDAAAHVAPQGRRPGRVQALSMYDNGNPHGAQAPFRFPAASAAEPDSEVEGVPGFPGLRVLHRRTDAIDLTYRGSIPRHITFEAYDGAIDDEDLSSDFESDKSYSTAATDVGIEASNPLLSSALDAVCDDMEVEEFDCDDCSSIGSSAAGDEAFKIPLIFSLDGADDKMDVDNSDEMSIMDSKKMDNGPLTASGEFSADDSGNSGDPPGGPPADGPGDLPGDEPDDNETLFTTAADCGSTDSEGDDRASVNLNSTSGSRIESSYGNGVGPVIENLQELESLNWCFNQSGPRHQQGLYHRLRVEQFVNRLWDNMVAEGGGNDMPRYADEGTLYGQIMDEECLLMFSQWAFEDQRKEYQE